MVELTNTEYLRLLLQVDPKFRDRMWVLQCREHIQKMEWITKTRLLKERDIVDQVEKENENL